MIGTEVDVYFNLHKHVWSVRDIKTRRVIAHVDAITLVNVTFRVSAAGNARVRREGRKNVHAFARGTVVSSGIAATSSRAVAVTYNPHKHTTFVEKATGFPVESASMVWLSGKTVLATLTPAQVDGKVTV